MKWKTQQDLFKAIIKEEMELLNKKGAEYASDTDALANFKKRSDDIGIDPKQILWIFLSKHLDSIKYFIKKGQVASSEPIEGRIQDARNYLFLLTCLIAEDKEMAKKSPPEEEGNTGGHSC